MVWYRKAAEQGYAEAQLRLGLARIGGYGGAANFGEGATWICKAAEQGNALAQAFLGLMYDKGEGLPKDRQAALIWYRKAAEQGTPGPQAMLAGAYMEGTGVPKDLATAYMWANLAATSTDAKYSELRNTLEKLCTPTQIGEGQRLTREWLAEKDRQKRQGSESAPARE